MNKGGRCVQYRALTSIIMRAGASLNGHPNRFVEKERRREKKKKGLCIYNKENFILWCHSLSREKKTVSIFYKNVCALFLKSEPNGSERNKKSKKEKVIIFFFFL